MKKTFFSTAIVLAVAFLAACGGKETVSFDTVEAARKQARENAMYNAQNYRKDSPKYSDFDIQSNGDSSQTNECPQGDGWATLELIKDKQRVGLKCSTVSGNIGCLEASDFKTKAYATEDGHCQPTTKVPHPLPKIKQ